MTCNLEKILYYMIARPTQNMATSVFKWDDVFRSYESLVGKLLREKWNPESWWDHFAIETGKVVEPNPADPVVLNDTDEYFERMRANAAKISSSLFGRS